MFTFLLDLHIVIMIHISHIVLQGCVSTSDGLIFARFYIRSFCELEAICKNLDHLFAIMAKHDICKHKNAKMLKSEIRESFTLC